MRPLRLVVVAFVLGILVARALEGAPLVSAGVALLSALSGLATLARAPRLGLSLVALGVGAWCAPPIARATPALFDGAPWVALAQVEGMPKRKDEGVALAVSLDVVRRERLLSSARGRIRVYAPRLREPLGPGDRLLVQARLALPGRSCNPGACDGRWRAAAEGIDGSATVVDPDLILRLDVPTTDATAPLWALRCAMRDAIDARLPAEEAALVAALVVGERGGLDDELETSFRAAGVTHLLSVSGLHLAFAAGLLFALVRWLLGALAPGLGRLRPRDRWAAVIALPVVIAYAVLTGAEVATLRAAIVVGYAFVAIFWGQRLRALDALAFAALAILVPRPAYLFDPSFQLSFVSALATLGVGGGSTRGVEPRLRVLRVALAVARGVGKLVRVSLAATIATAPLTALHFSQVAPMGVLSNALAVPLTELLLVPIGLVGALLSSIVAGGHVHALGGCVLDVAGFLAWLLLAFVRGVASIAPVIAVRAPSTLELVVMAAAAIAIARAPGLRKVIAGALVLVALFSIEALVERAWPQLEIAFLDVGQGDAAVVLVPGHGAIVIDGGPGERGGAGERVIAPFLARRGVHRIELVILSHPHPDHSSGLPPLLERFPVGEIWTNGQETADPGTRALLAAAAARGIAVARPHALRIGAVTLAALAPRDAAGAVAADPLASENDNSLVVTLGYAGRRVLFAGDIEAEAEDALVGASPGRVDVLKVPHHGSRTSSSDALLDALQPRLAIASLADGNRYRFPHPEVLARYRARGIALRRTDLDGAVVLRIGPHGAMSVDCTRPEGCRR